MAWNAESVLAALPGPEAAALKVGEIAAALELDPTSASRACRVLRGRGLATSPSSGTYRLTPEGLAARQGGATVRGGQGERDACRRLARTTFRDRLWKALRLKAKGGTAPTIDELVELAADGAETDARGSAESYLFALARAGYLRKHKIRARGDRARAKGAWRYVLVRNGGPKTPIWRRTRNAVFDPNTGDEHPLGGEP